MGRLGEPSLPRPPPLRIAPPVHAPAASLLFGMRPVAQFLLEAFRSTNRRSLFESSRRIRAQPALEAVFLPLGWQLRLLRRPWARPGAAEGSEQCPRPSRVEEEIRQQAELLEVHPPSSRLAVRFIAPRRPRSQPARPGARAASLFTRPALGVAYCPEVRIQSAGCMPYRSMSRWPRRSLGQCRSRRRGLPSWSKTGPSRRPCRPVAD